MDHRLIARSALSFLCAVQGIATVAIDLNQTHATNPSWTGHARFHVVWQSNSVFLISVVELLLIWVPMSFSADGFNLAALLAAISPLGFLGALGAHKLYGGTLSDANGIPSARLRVFGAIRAVDLNLAAVVAALLSLLAIVAIYRT